MKLNYICLTGVDDTVSLPKLSALYAKYPFIQFGVPFDLRKEGTPRYPSPTTRKRIETASEEAKLPLSAHLCGQYLENVLTGHSRLLNDLPNCYTHIQLNFGGYSTGFIDWESVLDLAKQLKRFVFIVQFHGLEEDVPLNIRKQKNIALLMDSSHGRGVLPHAWPDPIEGISCGYAGGLSPDNISDQLVFLEQVVAKTSIWIDVESGIRDNKNKFCMNRTEQFLDHVKAYV